MLLQSIYDLYSSAAYEFPERAQKWMPEWLKAHPAFGKVKGDRVFKIFQSFGLNDFREQMSSDSSIEELRDFIISQLSYVVKNSSELVVEEIEDEDIQTNDVIKRTSDIAKRLWEISYSLLQETMKNAMWESPKHKLPTQVASKDKKLRIDAGTSIIKAYNTIRAVAASIDIHIDNIESSNEFKNYSKRGSFSVVFSTSPEDIAAMSSRSEWGSCQTLDGVVKGLNSCVIGSSLSKFIGIIYITTGDNFQGRGEKMIARSLVRFVVDLKTKTPAILIDKMYPAETDNFVRIMKSAIQKRTNIPVHFAEEISIGDNSGRFKIPEEKTNYQAHERSYLDNPDILTTNFQPINDPESFLNRSTNVIVLYVRKEHMIRGILEFSNFYDFQDRITRNVCEELMINVRKKVLEHYMKHRKFSTNQLIKLIKDEFSRKINRAKILKIVNNIVNNYIDDISEEDVKKINDLSKTLARVLSDLPDDIFTE